MRFGLHFLLSCSGSQTPRQLYRDAIEQAVHAESLGFESVWPVEHHFNEQLSSLSCPSLLLAAIAERTQRLRLGTAIVQLPLGNPIRVAEEIATLDVLSDGRVEFGVGRGANPSHFAGFNIPVSEGRERLREGLELIRAAWTQERFSYAGQYYKADDLALSPRPIQSPHPRVLVAVNSADTATFAGRAGYAAMFASHVNPFPQLKELVAIYRAARAESDHAEASADDITLLAPTYIAPTLERARAEFEPSILHASRLAASLLEIAMKKASSDAERDTLRPVLERFRNVNFERIRSLMGIVVTPEECRARFAEIERDFNPGRVITWFNYGGLVSHERAMQAMSLFAKTML